MITLTKVIVVVEYKRKAVALEEKVAKTKSNNWSGNLLQNLVTSGGKS